MLSNMPKSVFNGLAALTVAIPVVAWSTLAPVHNVRSSSMTGFQEYNHTTGQFTLYTVTSGKATFSWQEGTLQSFGNVQVKTQTDSFEFKLVRTTSSDSISINGEWDVFKNGTPRCAGCKGYMNVSPPGDSYPYLKAVMGDDKASYTISGDLDPNTRYDY
ncbi:hypothetical protein ATI61_106205 [Archangium gephyra]|uniref:Uncharacterized protein n=1 Tax=Archangium gephyra TaxID=48 RepID=A0AAC8Q0N8_9BACT|nr:hypothetical protein [Archangium gephyra]AKI98817.1 Hypothetical protein AA314_00444 [Archangium gephyra]REG30735.1 hypothetical protein ATI61_106205 [Archangium gephyra]